eukprot:5352438-Alexandrium_andersonii.AAC.1
MRWRWPFRAASPECHRHACSMRLRPLARRSASSSRSTSPPRATGRSTPGPGSRMSRPPRPRRAALRPPPLT